MIQKQIGIRFPDNVARRYVKRPPQETHKLASLTNAVSDQNLELKKRTKPGNMVKMNSGIAKQKECSLLPDDHRRTKKQAQKPLSHARIRNPNNAILREPAPSMIRSDVVDEFCTAAGHLPHLESPVSVTKVRIRLMENAAVPCTQVSCNSYSALIVGQTSL